MAQRGNVRVSITADADGLKRATRDAERHIDGMSRSGTKSFGGLKTAALGAAAVIGGGLVVEAKRMVEAYRESERVTKQTEAVLKSTGHAANVTAKEVEGLSRAISRKTGIDDEAIQRGQNLLLTFTGIRNEVGRGNDIFDQATQTITDMSVALDQDFKSSAIQLGKALNDPIKGVTALQRVGVQFTAAQKEQIAVLVESGEEMKAQKIILGELKTEFGGSAEAVATPWDRLRVTLGNLEEVAGEQLAPALDDVANALLRFIDDWEANKGTANDIRNTMLAIGDGINAVGRALGAVTRHWRTMRDNALRSLNFVLGAVDKFLGAMQAVADAGSKLPVIGGKWRAVGREVEANRAKVAALRNEIRMTTDKDYRVRIMFEAAVKSGPKLVPLEKLGKGAGQALLDKAVDDLSGPARKQLEGLGVGLGSLGGKGVKGVDAFNSIARRFGLVMTSGFRPGDPGWHGKNRARDYSDGYATPGELAFARFLAANYGSKLKELIHTPLGFGIKNGKRVGLGFWGPAVNADHYDHVHVAYAKGGKLNRPATVTAGEEAPRYPEYWISTNPRDRARSMRLLHAARNDVVGNRAGGPTPFPENGSDFNSSGLGTLVPVIDSSSGEVTLVPQSELHPFFGPPKPGTAGFVNPGSPGTVNEFFDELRAIRELLEGNRRTYERVGALQAGVLKRALADAVSGQIGGALGLGFQSPSAAGRLANY